MNKSIWEELLIRWGQCSVYPLQVGLTVYVPVNWAKLYSPLAQIAVQMMKLEKKKIREITFEDFMREMLRIVGFIEL